MGTAADFTLAIPVSAAHTENMDASLGLSEPIVVCQFDLDGVLTDTASVHAAAWKESFDPLLNKLVLGPLILPK